MACRFFSAFRMALDKHNCRLCERSLIPRSSVLLQHFLPYNVFPYNKIVQILYIKQLTALLKTLHSLIFLSSCHSTIKNQKHKQKRQGSDTEQPCPCMLAEDYLGKAFYLRGAKGIAMKERYATPARQRLFPSWPSGLWRDYIKSATQDILPGVRFFFFGGE